MASSSDKPWNRPWSMEEMIENSENWSLAGDVALLNTIKAFAETMLTKTVTLSDNVDDLLNNMNEVGLKLDISQNEFQSLRNTQFIESRVYEDDETLDSRQEVKEEEKEPTEEEKEKMIKESILEGLAVMDKYFDKIEVSISDSEDESDTSYVLQAKDLYADRPLPLIIGTEEWYKKWHVGLADSSSESETENVSEIYSASDSEDDLPKDMLKGSETSSELDFSSQASENRPVANSTFNDSVKKPDIFASDEESDEQGSLPVKTPISSKSFAEQLAAKLGSVISEREDVTETEVNRKPIQPAQASKFAGSLFSDEPPPLDDLEDTILPKSAHSGLFSGGQGLFDDNEDDLFWGQQNKTPKIKPEEDKLFKVNVKSETAPTASKEAIGNVTQMPKSSQVSKGLFDSDDSSDEDIFAANKKRLSKQPFLQPYKIVAPLFDDKPPELDVPKTQTQDVTKKKPVGGVSIFGTSNIFGEQKIGDILKNQQNTGGDEEIGTTSRKEEPSKQNVLNDNEKIIKPKLTGLFDDEADDKIVAPLVKAEPTNKSKKISLFEDDDDLFKEDLFSNITSKKPTSNLFDDKQANENLFETNLKNNNTPKVDLFSDLDNVKSAPEATPEPDKSLHKPKKNISLFSDNEDEEDIFDKKPNLTNKVNTTDIANNNTVNTHNPIENVNLKTDVSASETDERLSQRQVIGAEKRVLKGLFDDDNDNENETTDDLFKNHSASKPQDSSEPIGRSVKTEPGREKASTPPPAEEKPGTEPPALQVTSPTPKATNEIAKPQEKSAVSLFGSSPPPPDDDDWDAKSDNFSDDDQFSYLVQNNSGRLSLFDNEPPSLDQNESSGIGDDYNTRVDTDDSSFYPYASSSRRLSSDIYNEQQSQDSFFVTKNQTESINVPSHLGVIPEDTKSSILSITPSGKLEDLGQSEDNSSTGGSSAVDPIPPGKTEKPVSLFDDDYKSALDADDLFSFTSEPKSLPTLSDKRLSLFDNVEDILEQKQFKPDGPPVEKSNPKKSGLDSDGKNKVASIAGQLQSGSDKDPPKAPSGSPGKLKHKLNINVNALVPGYAPPRLKDMSKSHSLDLPKEEQVTPTNLSSSDVSFFTPDLRNRAKDVPDRGSEKAVSFGGSLDNVEVLHSVTKDRAKIPIKRRPSTRRGRQQAIRKSEVDVSPPEKHSDDNSSQLQPSEVTSTVAESEKAVDTDSMLKHSQATAEKTPPISQPSSMVSDIFDNRGEDDLFPGVSAAPISKSKSSIFDSADSDNDLFSPSNVKKPKTESASKTKPESASKKSLFNDSSSDDDLFSTSSADRKKEQVSKPAEKKAQKTSMLRKLENIEAEDDPLSSLLK